MGDIDVRDGESGGVSDDGEVYGERVRLIREGDEDMVINVRCGGGGDLIGSVEDGERGGEGSWIERGEEGFKGIGELLGEMCRLDCGSVKMGDGI